MTHRCRFPKSRPSLSRRWALVILALLTACTTALRAAADDRRAADLQLILAVDASGSVNERRFELQKQGYLAAFRHPRVLQAIRSGPAQAIAVTMVQWTGPAQQVQAVPWVLVRDAETIEAFARSVERAPRQLFSGGTSISGAIDYSVGLFDRSPFADGRRVIDVSGDGANNRGRPSAEARDEAVRAGITINGLPILELEWNLAEFYRNNVIGGPNAFMIEAKTFEEFSDAILKKLILEIADRTNLRLRVVGHSPAAGASATAGPPFKD